MRQIGYDKDGHGELDPGRYEKNARVECGCGCELYEGDNAYTWDGERMCEECVRERVLEMPLGELADMLGLLCETVRF